VLLLLVLLSTLEGLTEAPALLAMQ
jgi:hypothetical protein